MISVRDLAFEYPGGGFCLRVTELSIRRGEAVALVGPSGCGKTTLLQLVAGILVPSSGDVSVDGVPLARTSEAARRKFRVSRIGLVFQGFELLDYLDVRQNVLLPYRLHAAVRLTATADTRARRLAERVGLSEKLRRFPERLSQGEKQRVALCRALVTEPSIVLADEPTSSLDADNAARSMDLLFELVRERSTTLLMLTHEESVLERFDRVVRLDELAASESVRQESP